MVNKKTDFEKKLDNIKKATKKTAKEVEREFKTRTSGLNSWWSRASDEEKIYMVLGIISLIIGLYLLIDILMGMIFIIIGLLFVTGFFVKKSN